MAGISAGAVRLVNMLPFVPVLVAECVSPDFEVRQRKSAEALAIIAKGSGFDAERVSLSVRKGGIHQEILEEASAIGADLVVMRSHRPRRPAAWCDRSGCRPTRLEPRGFRRLAIANLVITPSRRSSVHDAP
jgi:nucleotide-binding universal stress UspA family protein